MNLRTQIRRISAKRLAELDGKIPFSTITPRLKFPRKGKPRSTRGTSIRKEKPFCIPRNTPAAAGLHRSSRRLNVIGKHWLSKPDIIFRGEREICNPATVGGRAEYRSRTDRMVIRQDYLCCNCREPLVMKDATFEHENGRGAGKRDDRIEINGQPINGASHLICNQLRGSKRTPIWHGESRW